MRFFHFAWKLVCVLLISCFLYDAQAVGSPVNSFRLDFKQADTQEMVMPQISNMIVVSSDGDRFSALDMRFRVRGDWTSWQAVLGDDGTELDGDRNFSQPLFSEPFDAIQLRSNNSGLYRVHYELVQAPRILEAQAGIDDSTSDQLKVISRLSWGADESLRFVNEASDEVVSDEPAGEANGNEKSTNICSPLERAFPSEFQQYPDVTYEESGKALVWPIAYSKKIQKIVVHHTAGEVKDVNGDGQINAKDYALQMNGIYRFHALTRNWGDIGYNFLIDPLGNIYEGRAGRAGIKIPVAAHVLCQNTGSLGIALLGNFSQQDIVPIPQKKALSRLIGKLSKEQSLSLTGKSSFRGELLPNVIGHRDVGAITQKYIGSGGTSCPGDSLYKVLSEVISGARAYQNLDYDVSFADMPSQFVLTPGFKDAELNLRVTNSGVKNLESLTIRLSNGLESSIGDLVPGASADAQFIFKSGMTALHETISVRAYAKTTRVFKQVGSIESFDLVRQKGFVKIMGMPQVMSQDLTLVAGTDKLVILRYPIETNANLPAGFFRATPYTPKSKSYVAGGSSAHDVTPQSKTVDIPLVFNVDANATANANVKITLQISSKLGKITSQSKLTRVLSTLSVSVIRAPLDDKHITFVSKSATLTGLVKADIPLQFAIETTGISPDILRGITDGDLTLKLRTSTSGVKIKDSQLDFALSENGSTLVAETSVRSTRRTTGRIEAKAYFGSREIGAFTWKVIFGQKK